MNDPRVVQVDIENIRSIDKLTLQPSALNVVSGGNGEGKSTVLMAIKEIFDGGWHPKMLRNLAHGRPVSEARYARSGKIRLTLSTGTTITKTITEKGYDLKVLTVDGLEVPKPQKFVEDLASGFGFDPISFVDAKPKDRLAYLQRALGISFSPEEVLKAGGLRPPMALGLDGLDLVRKQIFDARTAVNTLAKRADATVERLGAALVDDEAKDWQGEVKRLQAEREGVLRQLAVDRQAIVADANVERDRVNSEANTEIAKIEKGRAAALLEIARQETNILQEADGASRISLDSLATELGSAQMAATKADQNLIFRQEIGTAKSEASTQKDKAASLTEQLKAIDSLKKSKLTALEGSIPGMEVQDGMLFVDGVDFDSLNTGRKYLLAFQAAALAPGDLGMLIADGSNVLEAANWEAFKAAALESGFQIFTARVTEGPLQVETIQKTGE